MGRRHLDGALGDTGARTAADTADVGARHRMTLNNPGAGLPAMARLGDTDQSPWLNGTDAGDQRTGYAATSGPVVDAAGSVTVSTRVLHDAAGLAAVRKGLLRGCACWASAVAHHVPQVFSTSHRADASASAASGAFRSPRFGDGDG